MTDKERILTTLIRELCSTQLMCLNGYHEAKYQVPTRDQPSVHFKYEGSDFWHIPDGSLVLCETGGTHDWTIGYLEHKIAYGEAMIREIGSDRRCRVSNESFRPIVGMYPADLWERDEYEFSLKVLKAFRRADEHWHCYGGIDMGHPATLWVRERYGGLNNPSKPYAISLKWNKRTSIKSLLEQMTEQGFGTREFEREADTSAKADAQ